MEPLIAIIGPTGAGKSQQSKALARRFNLARISTGDLLRATGDPDILRSIAQGGLADHYAVESLVGDALAAVEQDRGVVMDGYPRSMMDTVWLDNNLKSFGFELMKVIFIDIQMEESQKRLQFRGRTDDGQDVVEARWKTFANHTLPVIELYEGRKKLIRVNGSKLPDLVTAEISAVLQ